MTEGKKIRWQVYIARPDSLGGRTLRRQVTREQNTYRLLEEISGEMTKEEDERWGLCLPFLEADRENQGGFLPKVALLLQQAREFDRVVLLLREPLPEVLALMARHQEAGLKVTAVCARVGELYGGERLEETLGPVEELLDVLRERLSSSSPRKRLLLPYGEKSALHLTYAGDLASAALFVLRHDEGSEPLLVEGLPVAYGEVARLAAQAAGFEGKIQFGKEKLPKDKSARDGFRIMQGHALYPPQLVLSYLFKARQRGGQLCLSACVIMRDNEEDIGRCLASLAAADEIIVVDTGSVDRSVEIAKGYTDKIYHFDWIDDFAAAKNYALEQASGDWIVFPDSDEFFTEETAGGIHRLVEDYEGPFAMPMALSVRHANVDLQMQPLGKEGAVIRFWQSGLRYTGAVHEYLEYQGRREGYGVVTVPRDRVLMLHTGYAPERMAGKSKRNMELLEREKSEGKENPLYCYYKARGLYAAGKWQEAREEILRQYHAQEQPEAMKAEIYRLWYKASQQLGDEAGMEEARIAMEKDMPMLPDAYALKGAALWNEGREEEAAPLLLKALELSGMFLTANPQEIDVVSMDMPVIARELAEFYEKKGDAERTAMIRNALTFS